MKGSRLAAGLLLLLVAVGCGSDPSDRSDRSDRSDLGAPGPDLAAREDSSALVAEIAELRRGQRHEEGLARARRGLELSPRDALLHFELGLLLQATGELEAAEDALQRAVELQPAHYPSYRALGELAAGRGAPAEAAAHYERCAAGLRDHAGCRFGLALARIELGDLDAAAEPLAWAAEQLDRADAWSQLGQLERRRRRLPESIDAYSRALALDRAHLPSLLGLGQVLSVAGRREEGQALLEKHRQEAALEDRLDGVRRAAGQPGATVDVHLQLARLHRSRDDFAAAEDALRQALAQAPGFPPAVLALANHLAHHGDAADADALVDGLMPAMAGEPGVLFLQGTIDLARGDEAAALDHFEASLAQGPWPPPVYLDAGKAWSAAASPARAAAAFEQALAALPESAEAHLGLARSRRALGDRSAALAAGERAVELDPTESRAWLLLGVLKAELGDADEALRAFGRGLEARIVDLLAAGGVDGIRREVRALGPAPAALESFEAALAARLR